MFVWTAIVTVALIIYVAMKDGRKRKEQYPNMVALTDDTYTVRLYNSHLAYRGYYSTYKFRKKNKKYHWVRTKMDLKVRFVLGLIFIATVLNAFFAIKFNKYGILLFVLVVEFIAFFLYITELFRAKRCIEKETKKSRLFMVEGLPGTGKSTNSFKLYMRLIQNGEKVRWIHEVSQPHPTVFFTEAVFTKNEYRLFLKKYPQVAEKLNSIADFRLSTVGIDFETISRKFTGSEKETWYQELLKYDIMNSSLEKYEGIAIDKWKCFAWKAMKNKDEIVVMDSSIFQYQIFTYLLKNAKVERVVNFVKKVGEIIKPLRPSLVYLYRDNVEDAIAFLRKERGDESLRKIWERDRAQPYYENKTKDVSAYYDFLRDYFKYTISLFKCLECNKIALDISEQDWEKYEVLILDFLNITHEQTNEYKAPDGTFYNATYDVSITIKDNHLLDPEGTTHLLIAKSPREYFVENLPTILQFEDNIELRIAGQQIIPKWTETGLIYTREYNTEKI